MHRVFDILDIDNVVMTKTLLFLIIWFFPLLDLLHHLRKRIYNSNPEADFYVYPQEYAQIVLLMGHNKPADKMFKNFTVRTFDTSRLQNPTEVRFLHITSE